MEGGSTVDLAFLLRIDAGPALLRGSVVHAWCEEIVWMDDGLPPDDVLRARARRVAPGLAASEVAELLAEFRRWMQHENVRGALARSAYPEGADVTLSVERELPFVRRVHDEIQEGVIDRVVLVQREGRVVGAEVLDFKTDRIGPADRSALARRIEHYRPQIETYCSVIRERYGLAPDAVVGKLVFLEADVVAPLASPEGVPASGEGPDGRSRPDAPPAVPQGGG